MKFKFNKIYLLLAILIFIIETLIAIFLKTGFIRYTVGDFLVVILIYCFVKSFIEVNALKLAIAVFLFALCIELLQLYNVLSLLNMEHNKTAALLLGSTFQITDLVAYALGLTATLLIENKTCKPRNFGVKT